MENFLERNPIKREKKIRTQERQVLAAKGPKNKKRCHLGELSELHVSVFWKKEKR